MNGETLGTEIITARSLMGDAEAGLEEFNSRRTELLEQIATFSEALDSARDELRELERQHKKRLKQAGKYKSLNDTIIETIKNNKISDKKQICDIILLQTGTGRDDVLNLLYGLVTKEIVQFVNGFYTINIDYKRSKRSYNHGHIKESIFSVLTDNWLSVREISDKTKIQLRSVKSAIANYNSGGIIEVKKEGHLAKYRLKQTVPEKETVNDANIQMAETNTGNITE